jgi:hypothetical protein
VSIKVRLSLQRLDGIITTHYIPSYLIMNCDEYFKQLRTVKEKQVKIIHHLSNFTQYLEHNVIPSGLPIKLLPQHVIKTL